MFSRLYGIPPSRSVGRLYGTEVDDGHSVELFGDLGISTPSFDGGFTNSKKGTLVLWLRNTNQGLNKMVFSGALVTGTSFTCEIFGASNILNLILKNTAEDNVLFITTLLPHLPKDEWHCTMISWDLSVPKSRLYIDDVSAQNVTTLTLDGIPHTEDTKWIVGGSFTASLLIEAVFHQVYLNLGEFIDFDVESNRRKFLTADGTPAYLGADGSLPAGSVPEIFLRGGTAEFRRNRGSGPQFTASQGSGEEAPYSQTPVALT